MATHTLIPKITVDEFLAMNFGDKKVELVDGAIYGMAGGSGAHNRVQANLMRYLGTVLRGSGCRTYGADQGVRTNDVTTRYPDVSIYCGNMGPEGRDQLMVFDDPKVLIEVLSTSTRKIDEGAKLIEYEKLATVDTIVLIDPDVETTRVVQRLGPNAWRNELFPQAADVELPSLKIVIPATEIFAHD